MIAQDNYIVGAADALLLTPATLPAGPPDVWRGSATPAQRALQQSWYESGNYNMINATTVDGT